MTKGSEDGTADRYKTKEAAMMRMLMLETWEKGFVTYHHDEHYAVLFVPGSRRKIALTVSPGEGEAFLWYDRTRRLWRKTKDVFTLRRMLHHIQEGYEAVEIPKLAALLRELRGFGAHLLTLSQMSPKEREQLRESVGNAVMELDFVQNFWKEEARDQLEWVIPLRDSAGRVNPAVLRARTTTARQHLERRVEEALGIKAWIAHYLVIVERLIWALEHITKSARDDLDGMAWKQKLVGGFMIERASGDVRQLVLPPFRFIMHTVDDELASALAALSAGKSKEAQVLIRRAWEGLEMKAVRFRLERALLHDPLPMTEVTASFNALISRRITERGFRYPGKRSKARDALERAIRAHLGKKYDVARDAVKEAAGRL